MSVVAPSSPTTPNRQIQHPDPRIVLDIDGVIAAIARPSIFPGFSPLIKARQQTVKGCLQLGGRIITANGDHHLIPPGCLTFIAWLHQLGIQLHFASAGLRERNEPFLHLLVKESLSIPEGQPVPSYPFISRHDLMTPFSPLLKKDLTLLIPKDTLPNTILVEDNPSYATDDQMGNLLYTPPTTTFDFADLYNEPADADRKIIPLSIQLDPSPEEKVKSQQEVEKGSKIYVKKLGASWSIGFLSQDLSYTELSLAEYPVTTLLLEQASKNRPIHLSKELHDFLYEHVQSQNGRTSTVFFRVNQIFFVAGRVFEALSAFERNQTPLPVTASNCSVKAEALKQPDLFNAGAWPDIRHEKVYELGLQVLRRINPTLEFISPKTLRTLNREIPQEQNALLNTIAIELFTTTRAPESCLWRHNRVFSLQEEPSSPR